MDKKAPKTGRRVGLYLSSEAIQKMYELGEKLDRGPSSLITWLIKKAWDEVLGQKQDGENG